MPCGIFPKSYSVSVRLSTSGAGFEESDPDNKTEVAGDVCLDVAGVPIAHRVQMAHQDDNWRQTGETRTHYLHGGSLLLQHWVQAAVPGHDVRGPRPCLPSELACGDTTNRPLSKDEFPTMFSTR